MDLSLDLDLGSFRYAQKNVPPISLSPPLFLSVLWVFNLEGYNLLLDMLDFTSPKFVSFFLSIIASVTVDPAFNLYVCTVIQGV